jgi:hypothetical protein
MHPQRLKAALARPCASGRVLARGGRLPERCLEGGVRLAGGAPIHEKTGRTSPPIPATAPVSDDRRASECSREVAAAGEDGGVGREGPGASPIRRSESRTRQHYLAVPCGRGGEGKRRLLGRAACRSGGGSQ